MIDILDAIIIGAGPAGLAAGMVLADNKKKYLILERGNDLIDRDSNDPKDISIGVGGGGLFSDGKLSFPPSATNLWTQLHCNQLAEAYNYLLDAFKDINIQFPEFNKEWTEQNRQYENIKYNKNYSSMVLNNFMRARVLNLFYEKNLNNIITNCLVIKIEKHKNFYVLKTDSNKEYYCNKIIIASGKFGNKIIENISFYDQEQIFNKIEMGIRVESKSRAFIPYESLNIDYKLIDKIDECVEFRTFCCCKDGVVLRSEFDNYISFNGAKTQFKTGNSNIGLLLRATDTQSIYYQEMNALLKSKLIPFKIPINEFIESTEVYIGKNCDKILKAKINEVINLNDSDLSEFYVYGPETEYIGNYVKTNRNLSISDNIWLVGDVVGTFRGLIPAMVSGIYSAKCIVKNSEHEIKKSIDQLGINLSSTENMDLIFTAQSKKFFYCKDVICQYVLEQEKLPINPFRVFDYFLNDRVNRDIVRRGNNQLIQSCKELWVFGPIADGVLFEIALAKLKGKKIRFFSIGTRIDEIKEINDLNNITFEPEVHSRQIKKDDLIKFIKDINVDDGQIELSMYL